jgi:uroporphyrinogen decarboxylase
MNIFKDTLHGKKTNRPPVWFMRQAGRILPSYQALKEKYTFHELLQDPALAAKVTLLPVDDLKVDAAILFSDILVIPEALGMELNFTLKGPVFTNPLHDAKNQLISLKPNPEKLNHIYETLDVISKQKSPDVGLIGFCGAPFTTFCYMVHGNSVTSTFDEAIKLFYNDVKTTDALFEKITEMSILYATTQAEHSIDVFQLFDTHAGLIPYDIFMKRVLPYVKRITSAIRNKGIPVIYFPKGIGHGLRYMNHDIADFISIDWQTSLYDARKLVDSKVGLQGNLDPRILSIHDKNAIVKELEKYLIFGREENKWIFNTGHGLMPDNNFDNVKFVIDWIKSANWQR